MSDSQKRKCAEPFAILADSEKGILQQCADDIITAIKDKTPLQILSFMGALFVQGCNVKLITVANYPDIYRKLFEETEFTHPTAKLVIDQISYKLRWK